MYGVAGSDAAGSHSARKATEIRAAQTREADDLATAKARLLEAEAEVEQRERELTELTRSVVADETRGATLNRQLTEFEIRRKRFDDRLANVTREKQEAEAAADHNGALDSARKAAQEARHAAAAARTALLEAEGATTDARLAENYAREERQSADSAAAKLRAEQEALAQAERGRERRDARRLRLGALRSLASPRTRTTHLTILHRAYGVLESCLDAQVAAPFTRTQIGRIEIFGVRFRRPVHVLGHCQAGHTGGTHQSTDYSEHC